jgi:hypothetical protein
MDSLSPLRRAYLIYLSRAYALMHMLERRSLLGIRLKTWIRWLPVLLILVGWSRRWPWPALLLLLIVVLWVNYSLWRAKRDNYNRFVSDGKPAIHSEAREALPPNQKVAVRATGLFSVSGREDKLLLRPANYWRVPLGEHVVMVEEQPGKYLYQFFNAQTLQNVQSGWLLFGSQPIETLAVTFLARWGPDYTRFGQDYESGDGSGLPPPRRVTVYLSTADEATRGAIRQTIVADAQRARLVT